MYYYSTVIIKDKHLWRNESFAKKHHFFIIFVRNNMRKVKEQQMKFGEIDIATIEFDQRFRDEIPKLLMGLQHIYCTPELREEVVKILAGIGP